MEMRAIPVSWRGGLKPLNKSVGECFEDEGELSSVIIFHWSMSDNESLQISKTLLSNLADLNNATVE